MTSNSSWYLNIGSFSSTRKLIHYPTPLPLLTCTHLHQKSLLSQIKWKQTEIPLNMFLIFGSTCCSHHKNNFHPRKAWPGIRWAKQLKSRIVHLAITKRRRKHAAKRLGIIRVWFYLRHNCPHGLYLAWISVMTLNKMKVERLATHCTGLIKITAFSPFSESLSTKRSSHLIEHTNERHTRRKLCFGSCGSFIIILF